MCKYRLKTEEIESIGIINYKTGEVNMIDIHSENALMYYMAYYIKALKG